MAAPEVSSFGLWPAVRSHFQNLAIGYAPRAKIGGKSCQNIKEAIGEPQLVIGQMSRWYGFTAKRK